jgi:hypothetical protein
MGGRWSSAPTSVERHLLVMSKGMDGEEAIMLIIKASRAQEPPPRAALLRHRPHAGRTIRGRGLQNRHGPQACMPLLPTVAIGGLPRRLLLC